MCEMAKPTIRSNPNKTNRTAQPVCRPFTLLARKKETRGEEGLKRNKGATPCRRVCTLVFKRARLLCCPQPYGALHTIGESGIRERLDFGCGVGSQEYGSVFQFVADDGRQSSAANQREPHARSKSIDPIERESLWHTQRLEQASRGTALGSLVLGRGHREEGLLRIASKGDPTTSALAS